MNAKVAYFRRGRPQYAANNQVESRQRSPNAPAYRNNRRLLDAHRRTGVINGIYIDERKAYPTVIFARSKAGDYFPLLRRQRPLIRNFVEAACDYAYWAHEGERLKYVQDVYITHPKAVSERAPTNQTKALGYLHDVVESRVKEVLDKYDPQKDDLATYIANEEKVIWQTHYEIAQYFGTCGHRTSENEAILRLPLDKFTEHFKIRGFQKGDSDPILNLIRDLNLLTKRETDKDYALYIKRIIDSKSDNAIMIKYIDLLDNSDPDRNPPENLQKPKDTIRLARYEHAIMEIERRRPEIVAKVRRTKSEKYNPREEKGRAYLRAPRSRLTTRYEP